MKMPDLEIDGKKISCDVKRKNVRNVYLRLKVGFQLEIVLPHNEDINIHGILKKKRPWIEAKVKELSNAKKIFGDDTILYKGENIRVKVCPVKKFYPVRKKSSNGASKGLRLYKRVIFIYEDSEKKREEILRDFLTKQTLDYVQKEVSKFAKKLGVSYNTVSTKEMKKWGYSTNDRNLCFNWKLICLPKRLIDYIVFHEVLHLKHFNHSKQFKKDMAKYFIDHKRLGSVLRSYLPQVDF